VIPCVPIINWSTGGKIMERPTGVTILAVLAFIGAGFLVLGALAFIFGGAMLAGLSQAGGGALLGGLGMFAAVIFLAIAALYVVTGIGLLGLKNWARVVTIVLIALGLVSGAFGLVSSLTHFSIGLLLWRACIIALDVWILVYLFKPHVKQAFGAT
jgi:hypothetical protein